MPQRAAGKGRRRLLRSTLAIVMGCISAGCTAQRADDAFLKEALDERAAASARLAKAITHYCALTNDRLRDRDACILDRRLSVLRLEQTGPDLDLSPPPTQPASRSAIDLSSDGR